MEQITSQRGRKRAESEAALVRRQIEDVQRRRTEEVKKYDGMEAMLVDQLRSIQNAIADYDTNVTHPPQTTLQSVAGGAA